MSQPLIIVVTGSNRGIGQGIIKLLAKNQYPRPLCIYATSRSGLDLQIQPFPPPDTQRLFVCLQIHRFACQEEVEGDIGRIEKGFSSASTMKIAISTDSWIVGCCRLAVYGIGCRVFESEGEDQISDLCRDERVERRVALVFDLRGRYGPSEGLFALGYNWACFRSYVGIAVTFQVQYFASLCSLPFCSLTRKCATGAIVASAGSHDFRV